MSRIFQALVMIAVLSFGILLGSRLQNDSLGPVFGYQKKLFDVINLISSRYVDDVDPDSLAESGIKGMVESLDPHTVYLSQDKVSYSKAEFKGNFEGIGIEFDIIRDTLVVVAPLTSGPSQDAGIMAGDRILAIDSVSAIGIASSAVVASLRGEKGSSVHLDLYRPFSKRFLHLDVKRDRIPTYSIDASFLLDDRTGYIRLSRFVSTTSDEFVQSLSDLKSRGMKGLVVDLRGNPGGYLEEAVEIADEFLAPDSLIVYTKSRHGGPDEIKYRSTADGDYQSGPLVILVDRGSASAAEILAGALQDSRRAPVVGELTFGKGLVQRQFDLYDGSAIRLTIARYYTPLGRQIQRDYDNGARGREDYYEDHSSLLASESFFDDREDLAVATDVDGVRVYRTDAVSLGEVADSAAVKAFGGVGGIIPDFWVLDDRPGEYFVMLQEKGVIEETALAVLDDSASRVRELGGSLDLFLEKYAENQRVERYLEMVCRRKNMTIDALELEREKTRIMIAVKSRIARQLFGIGGQIRVLVEEADKVLLVAREQLYKEVL
ncbi:carboxyl-terminal protease [Prosthecochloris aestuarii DSM 271]|uniref:Carboxyl-terminal protease n=1 Tax=Prosthecochloris aestuarii (strain DSM 271 / SK 413) TaxID=290512 RepID=B4S7L2_PROA2|nr:S41 family peptidase [Prosthecochloris aestuarii]ACF46049.1 carboxyl-terminal protease [Prosthecochloris aestuarii DSM 271]